MRKGFTLIELLVTIGIVSILGTAVVVVLNPAEYLRQSRDTNRLSDSKLLEKTLTWLSTQDSTISFGAADTIYISLPDSSPICASYTLPPLPSPYTYSCKPESDYQKTDGSGWLPVNLSSLTGGTPISRLPIDPKNSILGNHYYAYAGQTRWHLSMNLESEKLSKLAYQDGGSMPANLELGTDLSLYPFMRGMIGMWSYNNSASDASGLNNNDSGSGGVTYTNGLTGMAAQFDGVNDYMGGNLSGTPVLKSFTLAAWIKTSAAGTIFALEAGGGGSGIGINSGTGDLRGKIMDAGTNLLSLDSGVVVTDNAWHHVVLSFDDLSRQAKLYLDGELILSGTASGGINSATAYTRKGIGTGSHWGYFSGLIDEASLRGRAISDSEVLALYSSSL